MRSFHTLAMVLAALALSACGGIETAPADTTEFAQANYRYYSWRTEPLVNTANSRDPIYVLDPLVRESVDTQLQELGYRKDAKLAQFDVHFATAPGTVQGFPAEEASNITTRPQAINRQVDQATIDNAHALSGVRDTERLAILFNDIASGAEVWHVIITKIVEDANATDSSRLRKNVDRAVRTGLKDLPPAS